MLEAFASREALMEAVAARLAEALSQAIAASGDGCVALSGGTTPAPAYERLARQPLDWPRVKFALVDERFVAPAHEASNEGLLRRTLAPALAAGASLVPMFSAAADIEAAARRAEALYAPLRIDAALLGMGGDGHIASWFPGAAEFTAALDPANARNVLAMHAPQAYATPERLTLSLAAVARARRTLLVITGGDKRALLADALAQAREPAASLFAACRPEVLWAA
jgi:6-phosphogluconolactonase